MHKVYLGLGANLGDRRANIEKAVALIGERVGPVLRRSTLIETAPWGFESENRFLNGVVLCQTELEPREVLLETQKIERELGRRRKSRSEDRGVRNEERGANCQLSIVNYHDRPIDIDILLYDDLRITEPDLQIPHPLMKERDFVMIPLREICQNDSLLKSL